MYREHTTVASILIVVVFVLLANFVYIFITNPDPLILRSGLPAQNGGGYLVLPFAGGNSIEGNDGITKQALGVQANNQILNGQLPLWNHYEGVGAPLLGETQSAALSPFTLLLSLPNGFLVNEVVLEMIAGIGTYLFIRRLRDKKGYQVDNLVAISGGCLFATLGTFMMLPNACFNPIAFLPWSMLGITLIFSGSKRIFDRKNIVAMMVLAVSVILALNSGFPETAFINMILVSIYAIFLFVKTKRSEKVSRIVSLGIPGILTVLVSLPWLVEFLTYINPANGSTGIHNNVILGGLSDSASAYLSSFIPNIIGFGANNPVYGDIGGFFTVSGIILAIYALFSREIKLWHKLLFGGWFLIGWMRVIGVPLVSVIIAHIPMLGSAAVYRYIPASMSFSLIILSCLSLNQIAQNKRVSRRVFATVLGFTIVFYGYILYGARSILKNFVLMDSKHALFAAFFLLLSIFASIAVLLAVSIKWKYKKQFLCLVLVIESLLCFSIWQLGASSKQAVVNTQSAQFLQQNLGKQRFDSNIIRPNYGSYFNISQISMMDLPIPTLWADYIKKNMDAYIPSIGYLSNKFDANRIEQDRSLGVKYLVVVRASLDNSTIQQQNLGLVYSDQEIEIFEIPNYTQYLSGDSCSAVSSPSFDKFTVKCSQDSQIRRLELFYPGWHVKIDGKDAEIQKDGNLFQKVDVSKGEHEVEFYYWPKYMTASVTLAGIGTATILLVGIFLATRRGSGDASSKSKKPQPTTDSKII